MTTISQFIPSQLPTFIQEQYPEFCEFLKSYYEYLELPNNPIYKSQRLLSELSLDSVSEEGLLHLVNYVGKYLPSQFTGDKTHLLKHIKEFYLSRGTEESYRFFMSMLYGFSIGNKTKIDYPIKRVLHTSSGEWTQRRSLKIDYVDVDLSSLLNKKIIDDALVYAIIENAVSYTIEDRRIIELFLQTSSISGEFNVGPAIIEALDLTVNILPVISGIKIVDFGTGYNITDDVVIAFDYDKIDGLTLDTTKEVTTVDSGITDWNTFSYSGINLSQATPGDRPLLSGSDNQENLIWPSAPIVDTDWTTPGGLSGNVTFESVYSGDWNGFTTVAVHLIDNAVTRNFYRNLYTKPGVNYNFSFLIRKDDNTAPVSGTDFHMVALGNLQGATVTSVDGNLYKVSLNFVGDGLFKNFGVVKGSIHSADPIKVQVFHLRTTLADAAYVETTTNPIYRGANGKPIASFDGVNDNLESTYNSDPTGGCGAIVFVRPDKNGIARDVIAAWNAASSDTRFLLQLEAADRIGGYIASSTTDYIGRISANSSVVVDEPMVIGFSYDASYSSAGIKLYKNLVRVDTTDANLGTLGTHAPGHTIKIGSRENSVNFFSGAIGDVIYWQGFELPEDAVMYLMETLYKKFIDSNFVIKESIIGENLKISDIISGQIYKLDVSQSGLLVNTEDTLHRWQRPVVISETGVDFESSLEIGATSKYPGFYRSNRNLLSEESIRLQDNNFYQQFSYVIESPVALNNYQAQILDALHPAGRKMFGKFQFEEMIEFVSDAEKITGGLTANLFSESLQRALPESSYPAVHALIQPESINAVGLGFDEMTFLSYRAFYPNEQNFSDMQLSDGFYSGVFSYNFSDRLTYIGGIGNTQAGQILANEALQPDPILYKTPFQKQKAKIWLSGSSKITHKDSYFDFAGALASIKYKVAESNLYNFGNNDFGIKLDFYPRVAENKALVALCGSGFFTASGALSDSEIWGGNDDIAGTWPSTNTSRAWGVGFNASRQVYVKLFAPNDDNVAVDGTYTYVHTSVLSLDTYHSVTVSFDAGEQEVYITVNGTKETFSHPVGINLSTVPLTIGSTYRLNSTGRSHTFNGIIRNLALYNRKIEDSEFVLLKNKNYNKLSSLQKHGLVFFSELSYPYPVDNTDYNGYMTQFVKSGDSTTETYTAITEQNSSLYSSYLSDSYFSDRGAQIAISPERNTTLSSGAISLIGSFSGSGITINQLTTANYPLLTRDDNKENLAAHSSVITGSSWNNTSYPVTVTDNFTTNYLGTTTAAKITASATSARHGICNVTNRTKLAVGEQYALEVDVKKSNHRYIWFGDQSDSPWHGAGFDLDTGLYTGNGNQVTSKSVSNLGSGWYRLQMIVTSEAGHMPSNCVFFSNSGSDLTSPPSFTPVGTEEVYICRPSTRRITADSDYIETSSYPLLAGVNGNKLIHFDGTNDSFATNLPTDHAGGSWAIAFVRPRISSAQSIIASRPGTSSNRGFFNLDAGGSITVEVAKDDTNYIRRSSPASSYAINEAFVVRYTYDGGTVPTSLSIYKNGVKIDSTSVSVGTYTLPAAGANLTIARNDLGSLFDGVIGDLVYGQGSLPAESELKAIEEAMMQKYLVTREPNTYSNEYTSQSRKSIKKIYDQCFWNDKLSEYVEATESVASYNSSFSARENLIRCSENISSSVFTNITPSIAIDRTSIELAGSSDAYYTIVPDCHITEEGNYKLKLEIESDIKNPVGNVKGFSIIQNGVTIAYLYKRLAQYYYSNISFTLSPDGNWINCLCSLNLTGDLSTGISIRMLTSDETSMYDFFTPIANNSIDIRKFHLYRDSVSDDSYISTKNIPILSGDLLPSIVINSTNAFEISSDSFNISNKAIFCVCVNTGDLIETLDFKLTTTSFVTNRRTSPSTLSIVDANSKRKLIRAIHKDGEMSVYKKESGQTVAESSSLVAIGTPYSLAQTVKFFDNSTDLVVYDFFVLEDPTDEEIEATTNFLISKYQL